MDGGVHRIYFIMGKFINFFSSSSLSLFTCWGAKNSLGAYAPYASKLVTPLFLYAGHASVSLRWSRLCVSTLVTPLSLYVGHVSVSLRWSRLCTSTLVTPLYLYAGHVSVSIRWSRLCASTLVTSLFVDDLKK